MSPGLKKTRTENKKGQPDSKGAAGTAGAARAAAAAGGTGGAGDTAAKAEAKAEAKAKAEVKEEAKEELTAGNDGESEAADGSLSIEESFAFLEDTIDRMSGEDVSLEESFSLFEKGMQVLKSCSEKIDEVEKKVKVIGGEGELEDFE